MNHRISDRPLQRANADVEDELHDLIQDLLEKTLLIKASRKRAEIQKISINLLCVRGICRDAERMSWYWSCCSISVRKSCTPCMTLSEIRVWKQPTLLLIPITKDFRTSRCRPLRENSRGVSANAGARKISNYYVFCRIVVFSTLSQSTLLGFFTRQSETTGICKSAWNARQASQSYRRSKFQLLRS